MSAPLSVSCPHCDATLKLKNREADGKKVRCPKCEKLFVVKLPPVEVEPMDEWEIPSSDEAAADDEFEAPAPRPSRKSAAKGSGKKKKTKPVNWQRPAMFAGVAVLLPGQPAPAGTPDPKPAAAK